MNPSRRTPEVRHKNGFTLTELLTAICIIVILTALLIPAVGKVRRMSMRIQTTSNLRQVHVALLAYAGDNNNTVPFFLYRNQNGQTTNWKEGLAKGGYLGAPDHPDSSLTASGQAGGGYSVLGSPMQRKNKPIPKRWDTFGLNSLAAGYDIPGHNGQPVHLSDFASPSRTLLLGEGHSKGANYGGVSSTEFGLEIANAILPTDTDDDEASLAFVDGHVERWKISSMPTKTAPTGSDDWYFWIGR